MNAIQEIVKLELQRMMKQDHGDADFLNVFGSYRERIVYQQKALTDDELDEVIADILGMEKPAKREPKEEVKKEVVYMPIVHTYEKAKERVNRHRNSHIRYLQGDEAEYLKLIDQAFLLLFKLCEDYVKKHEKYHFLDHVRLGGGGSGGYDYTVEMSATREKEWWTLSVADVKINFKEKKLSYFVREWADKEGRNPYSYEPFTGEINEADLTGYLEKYETLDKYTEETVPKLIAKYHNGR